MAERELEAVNIFSAYSQETAARSLSLSDSRSSQHQSSLPFASPKSLMMKTRASKFGGTKAVQRDAQSPKLFSQTAKPRPNVTRQAAPSSSAKRLYRPESVTYSRLSAPSIAVGSFIHGVMRSSLAFFSHMFPMPLSAAI